MAKAQRSAIAVRHTACEGDEGYTEFLCERLPALFPGYEIEVEQHNGRTSVTVDGDDGCELAHEVSSLVRTDLWDEFCSSPAPVTDDQVNELRLEAGEHNDHSMVDVCDRALNGDDEARAECAQVIEDARAQEEPECCSRCGRETPDGRERGLCRKCRSPSQPTVVDAAGARRQRVRDADAIRAQREGE